MTQSVNVMPDAVVCWYGNNSNADTFVKNGTSLNHSDTTGITINSDNIQLTSAVPSSDAVKGVISRTAFDLSLYTKIKIIFTQEAKASCQTGLGSVPDDTLWDNVTIFGQANDNQVYTKALLEASINKSTVEYLMTRTYAANTSSFSSYIYAMWLE